MAEIYQLLEKDHRLVEQLFKQILELGGMEMGGQSPMMLLDTLSEELKVHMAAEERAFYTPLAEKRETRELVNEGAKEHEEARVLLRSVMTASKMEIPIDRVQELQKAIDHHVKEEEGKIFRAARMIIDRDDAIEMGSRFDKEKERARGR